MPIAPSSLTSACAGAFSAVAWPLASARFGGTGNLGVETVLVTLLLVALPAHAFVVGFGYRPPTDKAVVDAALLRRVLAWLITAASVVGIGALIKG